MLTPLMLPPVISIVPSVNAFAERLPVNVPLVLDNDTHAVIVFAMNKFRLVMLLTVSISFGNSIRNLCEDDSIEAAPIASGPSSLPSANVSLDIRTLAILA